MGFIERVILSAMQQCGDLFVICRRRLVAKSLADASVIDKLPYANYDYSYVRSKLCSVLHIAAGRM